MQYLKERKQVLDVAQKIYREKMVPGTWGNVSLRVKGQPLLLITPSGMAYESMTIDDIVLLDLEGEVVEGGRVPSIESICMPSLQKKTRCGAVIHVPPSMPAPLRCGEEHSVILEETAQVMDMPFR
jgi:L-ribulose-5-phosphate 4-epimerase